jgi:PEGA domain
MAMGLVHGPASATPATPASSPGRAPQPTASAPARPSAGPATAAPAASPPSRSPSIAPKSGATGKPDDRTPATPQVKKARDLWYRGVDAFRAGKYEEARRAFAECYLLMPKSDVLRNLSISEIQSGHYVSAARHLKQLLAAPGDLPGNVREEATSRLAQAEAQIGQLDIGVDVAGAEIRIDGAVIGRSPLESGWYIEPGQHEVIISKAGYPIESRQVFALAGVAIPVAVSLETLRREQAADAKAAELMGTNEGQAPIAMDARSSIGTGSTVVLITTGTLAAASLAVGIIFTIGANGHDSNADGMAERLSGPGACNPGTALLEECAYLSREREASATDRNRATVSFIGFGVASAITLGYALWLTLDDDESVSQTTTGLEPSISVGRGTASIHLHARF